MRRKELDHFVRMVSIGDDDHADTAIERAVKFLIGNAGIAEPLEDGRPGP
jgi:hypothetical protein